MGNMSAIAKHLKPITEAFERSSASELQRLRDTVGVDLPESYLEFLRQYGRCMIDGDATVAGHGLFTFYGTKQGAGDVASDYLAHPDFVSQQLLPIADDLFNNRFLLDLSSGRVIFAVYMSGFSQQHVVAPTFQAFLGSIEVAPDDGA
jgi:hypothetical protein